MADTDEVVSAAVISCGVVYFGIGDGEVMSVYPSLCVLTSPGRRLIGAQSCKTVGWKECGGSMINQPG